MYFGVVGPYSMGKTTAFGEIVKWLGDNQHLPVIVVNCDNNRERVWEDGELIEEVYRGKAFWKGTVAEKAREVRWSVGDEYDIWLCETAWADHPRLAAQAMQECEYGVAEFVILTCKPDVYGKFLVERCAKRNKQFRGDYWTPERLGYEGTRRFLNTARKYLDPAGIPWVHYEVDYERKVWGEILDHIKGRLRELAA